MIRPLHDCAGSSELDISGADLFGYRVVPRAGQGKAEFGLVKFPEKLGEAATRDVEFDRLGFVLQQQGIDRRRR